MRRSLAASAVLSLSLFAAAAAPAAASDLLSTTVSVPDAVAQSCTTRPLEGGSGYTQRAATAPAAGWVTARLDAASGDWDLAIFSSDGRRVAGSTGFGASEVAQGFVAAGERLSVQACRRTGSARRARVTLTNQAIDVPDSVPTISLVRVLTPNADRKTDLTELGLDLTERGGEGFVDVVLHGARDAQALRRAKFSYTTKVGDLAAQGRKYRAADALASRRAHASALPSSRTTYRRLDDYTSDMKKLVDENPNLVKPITLPFKTYTGRSVQGIEITTDVNERDGKPVFLQMGIHHAREWPAGENAMEFAFELVNGYKSGDARTRRLVSAARTIVIPVVNPDGFNTSREAGETYGVGGGRPGNDDVELANLAAFQYEYQRKNCRVVDPNGPDPERGDCTQMPATGLEQFGVDPNRNYGGFWGGPGAAAEGGTPPGEYEQDYRGTGPFSEPETRNVRDLVSKRHVATLITNHTYSNLLLRPPGIQVQGPPPDETIYKALGDSMAAENGYTSQKSYELYDTTGGTEDWTYYTTGGLGFTFEIGLIGFHPPFANTVAEYEGTTDEADANGDGGGNREAYYKALASTVDRAKHSLLSGNAPAGAVLRLTKSFRTSTSAVIDSGGVEGDPILFDDKLDTVLDVPASGTYTWDINPSTRPVVAEAKGRPATGTPSPPTTVQESTPAAPCGAAAENPACYKDYPFTVPTGAGVDNARVTVDVSWASPASDYDITVYRDTDGDGTSNGETESVGTSAQGTTNEESTSFGEPGEAVAGQKYVVRVVNFAAAEPYEVTISYGGPPPFSPAMKESWTLTCEGIDGKVAETRQVQIDRGQAKVENFGAPCAKVAKRAIQRRDCVSRKGGVKPRRLGEARLGRRRKPQRRALGGKRLNSRKGIDRYCVRGGGGIRIGYPTRRLARKTSKRTRKRVRRKAILLVTSNRRFRVARVRVGMRARVARKRLKHERRYRVGRNTWFTVGGKKSRLLFAARKGRIRQVGLGNKRLSSTRRSTKRYLRAWNRRGL